MNITKTILLVILLILIILSIYFLFKDSFENSKIIQKSNGKSNEKPQIVLITEYFVHKSPARFFEIKKSIDTNDNNKYIDKIYLFNEKETDKYFSNLISSKNDNGKIINIPANKRTTFLDSFKLANTLPNGTIVIISNNDISFDDSLKTLYNINFDNLVICLSRRDAHNENKLEFISQFGLSQDSWIFKTPIKIPKECDFYFGTAACDHHIAYLLDSIGYNLINIPWDIKSTHNHKSEERKWVTKPLKFKNKYKYVLISKINNDNLISKKNLYQNIFNKIYEIIENLILY